MRRYEQWQARLAGGGHTASDLARRLNRSKSAVSRILTGERDQLKEFEIAAIERALNELDGRTQRPTGMIPLLGYAAAGGTDRIAWTFDRPMDWVEAPPMREHGGDVVAIRVSGDSMEPRLFSGETVYVGLNIAPARGGDVVIELNDATAVVKTYQGSRDGTVFAHQYNPDSELRFPLTRVKGLHAVLWRR